MERTYILLCIAPSMLTTIISKSRQMKNKVKIILIDIAFPVLGLGMFLLLWFVMSKIINLELILPTPYNTIKSLFFLLSYNEFWVAVSNTITNSLISYCCSLLAAFLLAILGYIIFYVQKILNPIISILRSIPTMAIILLLLIWFNSKIAPMIISALVVFPLLYSSFNNALKQVSVELIDMSNYYNVPKFRQITYLYIPSMMPTMLSAIQSTISLNLKVLIAAEVLAATKDSIGRMMQTAKLYLDTAELIAWTVVAIVLGALLESIIAFIKYIVVRRTGNGS